MANSVAILIIGSLIWNQSDHRQAWRKKRLTVETATRVRAPIRYGRHSKTKTYTMVFSNSLLPTQTGYALAVPCRCVVHTLGQAIEEAEALWAAEQSDWATPGPLAAGWGAIGLLPNPNRTGLDALTIGWSARIADEDEVYERFPHGDGEAPAVTPSGTLAIPWPITEVGEPLDVDLLLATATVPTLHGGAYAAPEVIAAAWQKAPEPPKLFRRESAARDSDSVRRRYSALFKVGRLTSKWGRRSWPAHACRRARLICNVGSRRGGRFIT